MQIILTAVQESLAQAWQHYCSDLDFVQIHHGSIFDVASDAVVSPANSFGFMNGGIDLYYRQYFGRKIEDAVKSTIRDRHFGEMLVGAADIVETHHPQTPYLIVAPTMRMPMSVQNTVNAYLAARGVFLLWKYQVFVDGPHAGTPIKDIVRTIAFPGLCTGVGNMAPEVAARQVRGAINDILLEQFAAPNEWGEVLLQHETFLGRPLEDI